MKYSIEVLQSAFNKTWDKLSEDQALLKFFDDKSAFLDFFTMVNRQDELGLMHRVDDDGHHKEVIFYTIYHKMATHLQPDTTRRSLSKDECQIVFSTLENRTSHIDDLKISVLKEEEKFIENMKTLQLLHQMYGYLYYHLYKGMVEILVNAKNEIRNDVLFNQIKQAKLSIKQSCMVLIFLDRQVINYTLIASSCGFSEKSVKAFRDFFTSVQNDDNEIYSHGRDRGKDFQRVLGFLKDNGYSSSKADTYYQLFKKASGIY